MSDFEDKFFDVRKHKPKKGQILAQYTAMAELVEGRLKKDIINLLINVANGGDSASKVMRKLACACEEDSYRVPKEMAEDLLSGMSENEVENKPYKYRLEAFYYTDREHVPSDDPHWNIIELINADIFTESELKEREAK